jgi:uncharacterized protein with GYD domain
MHMHFYTQAETSFSFPVADPTDQEQVARTVLPCGDAGEVFARGEVMPKYLIQASYTADGLKGLQKDKASGRRNAVASAAESLGGKLESFHFCFGEDDVIAIFDLPDNVAVSALSLAVSASGLVRSRTTPLMTVDEVDKALAKNPHYRAPGR